VKSGQKEPLITDIDARSPFAEAFRTLRTNINFAGLDNPYKTLVVTSAGPNEGKSTTSSNLGIVMAQANNKVLLVGADLRRPTLHRLFGVDDTVGITNVLVNDLNPAEVAVESNVPGLYILPSGPIPPNPAELIGSQRMQKMIERARETFDYVLIDSPPVLIVTDTLLLSAMVDGVILVIKSGVARVDATREAKGKLENVGAKIVGAVLNKVNMSSDDYYYYSYYYYHQGGGESKKKSKKEKKVASY
jgi:capsular exopolysaccharide synthesis family protein